MADLSKKWWAQKTDHTARLAEKIVNAQNPALEYFNAITGQSDTAIEALQMSIFYKHKEGLGGDIGGFNRATLSKFEDFKELSAFKEITGLNPLWQTILEKGITADLGEKIAKGEVNYADAVSGKTASQVLAVEMSVYFQAPVEQNGLGGDDAAWNKASIEGFRAFKTNDLQAIIAPPVVAEVDPLDTFDEENAVVITDTKTPVVDPAVLEVQAYAAVLGHDPGPIDGVYGDKTITGLYQYAHADNTIEGYGKMDQDALVIAIADNINTKITTDPAFQNKIMDNLITMIETGDRDKVKAAQVVLNDMSIKGENGLPLTVDGDPGDETKFALNTLKTLRDNGMSSKLSAVFQNAVGDGYLMKAETVVSLKMEETLNAGFEGALDSIVAVHSKSTAKNFQENNDEVSENKVSDNSYNIGDLDKHVNTTLLREDLSNNSIGMNGPNK